MKLLSKSEITLHKGRERQEQINEGVKVAKRIDNLRETAASEEVALEKFRKESISAINQEIVLKEKEKNELLKEVSDLEDRKAQALLPLDDAWREVHEKESELTEYALKLQEDRNILEQSEQEHEVEVELLKKNKHRVERERDQSLKSLADAEEKRDEAVRNLKSSQTILEDTKHFSKQEEKRLKDIEIILLSKERDIANMRRNIEAEHKILQVLGLVVEAALPIFKMIPQATFM